MSLNAATIEVLIAKGMTAQDILEVALATEVKADPTNAERQARHRAKKRNAVTVTDNAENKEIPPDPHKKTSPLNGSPKGEPIPPPDGLKPEHVVEAWNAAAERIGLQAVRKVTPERQRKIATRIRQNTIDDFTEAIFAIERSPFLRGENDRGWKACFDWMLEPKNFTKLIEGNYDH